MIRRLIAAILRRREIYRQRVQMYRWMGYSEQAAKVAARRTMKAALLADEQQRRAKTKQQQEQYGK